MEQEHLTWADGKVNHGNAHDVLKSAIQLHAVIGKTFIKVNNVVPLM